MLTPILPPRPSSPRLLTNSCVSLWRGSPAPRQAIPKAPLPRDRVTPRPENVSALDVACAHFLHHTAPQEHDAHLTSPHDSPKYSTTPTQEHPAYRNGSGGSGSVLIQTPVHLHAQHTRVPRDIPQKGYLANPSHHRHRRGRDTGRHTACRSSGSSCSGC